MLARQGCHGRALVLSVQGCVVGVLDLRHDRFLPTRKDADQARGASVRASLPLRGCGGLPLTATQALKPIIITLMAVAAQRCGEGGSNERRGHWQQAPTRCRRSARLLSKTPPRIASWLRHCARREVDGLWQDGDEDHVFGVGDADQEAFAENAVTDSAARCVMWLFVLVRDRTPRPFRLPCRCGAGRPACRETPGTPRRHI